MDFWDEVIHGQGVLLEVVEGEEEFGEMLRRRISRGELTWKEIEYGTSRRIIYGGDVDSGEIVVVGKKRRKASETDFDTQWSLMREEIAANRILAQVLREIVTPDGVIPTDSQLSVRAKVERPIGSLVDFGDSSYMSLFRYESGYIRGPVLHLVEPPIDGVVYDQRDWNIYCAIAGALDVIQAEALERGLSLDDPGVHQVLYDPYRDPIEIVLIDTEDVTLTGGIPQLSYRGHGIQTQLG